MSCRWTVAVCARGGSLVRALQAALYPPSAQNSMHLWSLRCLLPSAEVFFCLGGVYVGRSLRSDMRSPLYQRLSRSRVNATRWLVCFLPARGGLQRTHLASMCRSRHFSTELWKTVSATARETHLAHNGCSSLGMCRMVGTYLALISDMVGPAAAGGLSEISGAGTAERSWSRMALAA